MYIELSRFGTYRLFVTLIQISPISFWRLWSCGKRFQVQNLMIHSLWRKLPLHVSGFDYIELSALRTYRLLITLFLISPISFWRLWSYGKPFQAQNLLPCRGNYLIVLVACGQFHVLSFLYFLFLLWTETYQLLPSCLQMPIIRNRPFSFGSHVRLFTAARHASVRGTCDCCWKIVEVCAYEPFCNADKGDQLLSL